MVQEYDYIVLKQQYVFKITAVEVYSVRARCKPFMSSSVYIIQYMDLQRSK